MKIAIIGTDRVFGNNQDLATANFQDEAAYKQYLTAQGWGACEALMVSYARGFHRMGHEVRIFTKRAQILAELPIWKPDVGFIIHTSELFNAFPPETKVIVYQSHRECAAYPQAWDDDCRMAHLRCVSAMKQDRRIVLAALSNEIADAYKRVFPIMSDRIFVQDNPMDVDCFRYLPQDAPRKFGNNSIMLAQIGPRKNQAAYSHFNAIHFVGPPYRGGFGPFPAQDLANLGRYLGGKPRLWIYENLCEYGSACLFSKMEADVMVLKEAMAAGLAVVGNDASLNSNIRNLPWVFNIKDKANDIPQMIALANQATKVMGNEIRKWAERNLETTVKCEQFLESIKRF